MDIWISGPWLSTSAPAHLSTSPQARRRRRPRSARAYYEDTRQDAHGERSEDCNSDTIETVAGKITREARLSPELHSSVRQYAQRRCDPRACAYYATKRAEGKTPRAAMRCLKRRLVDVLFPLLRSQPAARPLRRRTLHFLGPKRPAGGSERPLRAGGATPVLAWQSRRGGLVTALPVHPVGDAGAALASWGGHAFGVSGLTSPRPTGVRNTAPFASCGAHLTREAPL